MASRAPRSGRAARPAGWFAALLALGGSTASAQAEPLWCAAEPLAATTALWASFAPASPPAAEASPAADWEAVQQVLDDAAAGPDAVRAARERLLSLCAALPELADQLDLFDGLFALRGAPSAADCERLAQATESVLPSLALEAQVAHVTCLLRTDDRRAEAALDGLHRRYAELPDHQALELLRAEHRERRSELRGALLTLRQLDLEHPGSPAAAVARAHLARLAERGERSAPLTPVEQVDRAARLVRSGPPELARQALEALREAPLTPRLRAEVRLLAARLARVEGRFDEARALLREARGLSPEVGDDPEAVARTAADLDAAAARSAEEAREELRAMGFGRTLRRVSASRLERMVHAAARSGLSDELGALLDELLRRGDVSCALREEAAIAAAGSADGRVAQLLEGCPSLRARYHRARALERSGQREAAVAALREVAASDDTDTGFYALWSEARLEALDAPAAPATNEATDTLDDALALGPLALTPMELPPPGPWSLAALELGTGKLGTRRGPTLALPPLREAVDAAGEVLAPPEEAGHDERPTLSDEEVLALLDRIGAEHAAGLPWIARARARLVVGDEAGATEELFTAWAAWHQASGGRPLRAGLDAVYRGAEAGRIPTDLTLRRLRRGLSPAERARLADVAEHLGDYGLAVRFGGASRVAARPRPYADLVHAAAARHGLDPNLLWAVMRVESIYNPRIVSYAGAIGLLQIMPRTGRLIAHRLGRADFTEADLLEPATNIEFAAWYLRSLLDRFDGRLPLAIAAYNGGPHNVRRWMAEHADALPVDALCERIPFEQTFRYVRRVLHHLRAYRAEAGLGLPALEPARPADAVDTVAF